MYYKFIKFTSGNVFLKVVDASPSDRFVLRDVVGLDGPEFEISMTPTSEDINHFQGRRAPSKEITMTIGLQPDYASGETVEQLRAELATTFSERSNNPRLNILFCVGEPVPDYYDSVAYITAYVKKFTAAIFSKEPAVQIVFSCLTPYFEALLEPGAIPFESFDKSAFNIENIGQVANGFMMEVVFTDDVSDWTISRWDDYMTFEYDFVAGQYLRFNTIPGQRDISIRDVGSLSYDKSNWVLSDDSVWLPLYVGDNPFATSSQDFDWYNFNYHPRYWGL